MLYSVDESNAAVHDLTIGLQLLKNIIEAQQREVRIGTEQDQGTESFFPPATLMRVEAASFVNLILRATGHFEP